MPFSRETLQIADLSIDEINRVLQRIQEYLDELKGLRNEVVIHDTINAKEKGFRVQDPNGTTIHGFGTFED